MSVWLVIILARGTPAIKVEDIYGVAANAGKSHYVSVIEVVVVEFLAAGGAKDFVTIDGAAAIVAVVGALFALLWVRSFHSVNDVWC